jgi:hypothetical protein
MKVKFNFVDDFFPTLFNENENENEFENID